MVSSSSGIGLTRRAGRRPRRRRSRRARERGGSRAARPPRSTFGRPAGMVDGRRGRHGRGWRTGGLARPAEPAGPARNSRCADHQVARHRAEQHARGAVTDDVAPPVAAALRAVGEPDAARRSTGRAPRGSCLAETPSRHVAADGLDAVSRPTWPARPRARRRRSPWPCAAPRSAARCDAMSPLTVLISSSTASSARRLTSPTPRACAPRPPPGPGRGRQIRCGTPATS